MSMGNTIKKYRKLKGLTQKELGEKIGRTQRTIQAYEKNEVIPPLTIIENISKILGVEKRDLISGDSLDEKLENIKNMPKYDESDIEDFAKQLNIDYLNLNPEGKNNIADIYVAKGNIYRKMVELTETDMYIYDFNLDIHNKAPIFKKVSIYDIETIYKGKIKRLKDELNNLKTINNNLEKINKTQDEIIKLQKEKLDNVINIINKLDETNKEGE